MIFCKFIHHILLRFHKTYLSHDPFLFYKFFYKCNYHKHINHHHSGDRAILLYNGNRSDNFYIYSSFFCQLKSQPTNLSHNFLIIFFLLNVIEELISIFCFPFSCVFNIPITCLYLPIRSFVLNCK